MKSLAGDDHFPAVKAPAQAKIVRPAPWMAFLGVDGSGKSSILRELGRRQAELPFKGIRVLHRRPRIVYPSPTTKGRPISHYSKPKHGGFTSWIKIAAMLLDWHAGYWRKIYWQRREGYLVIADRHSLLDMLADPERYRYGGSERLVQLALHLAPAPDLVLLLDAPEEVLQSRKQELSLAQITRLRKMYLEIFKDGPNTCLIDATRPLADIVTEIVDVIDGYLQKPR